MERRPALATLFATLPKEYLSGTRWICLDKCMGVLGSTFTIPKFDVVIHYNVNEHRLDLDSSEEPSRARDQFKSLVYTRGVLVL